LKLWYEVITWKKSTLANFFYLVTIPKLDKNGEEFKGHFRYAGTVLQTSKFLTTFVSYQNGSKARTSGNVSWCTGLRAIFITRFHMESPSRKFDFQFYLRISVSKPTFNMKSSFNFEFRLRASISSFDSSFDSEFRFQLSTPRFDFKLRFRVSISTFDFDLEFRFRVLTSSLTSSFDFEFRFPGVFPVWYWYCTTSIIYVLLDMSRHIVYTV